MGDVGVRDASDRVVAVVRDAGRDEYTIRKYQVVLERFAAFLTGRGNAEATVVTKDKAASRFLAYLVEVGVDDLAALGVRDVSGFLLRQRGLRRKTVAAMRSCLADLLGFLAAAGRTPRSLADRLPPPANATTR